MANVSVAVLGMGRLGASVALALKRYNERKDAPHQFEVVCADLRVGAREDAAALGLKVERNLFDAVQNRDIVVLALPYADVPSAYKTLAREFRPGAVLLDLSPLKQPSLKWAEANLPNEVHMVGMTPIVNPAYLFDGLDDTRHAAADLFDKGNILLVPGVSAIRDAIELASDFSVILGATPHFVDPAEHDSLMALTDNLPGLLGVAAFYTAYKRQGWNDAQRLTNPGFGRLTHQLHDTHPDDLRDTWLNNRDSLLRHLDAVLDTLQTFRSILATNDRDALDGALTDASEAYSTWINRRHNARWEQETPRESGPTLGGQMMNSLMGGFLSRRLGGRKNGDEKE
ncbi:MAG: prephenate dehydrogenase [Chloroflexi bacterium]|nr:prephenate dehydrogenase [Chloroflexota bacterium]